MAITALRVSTDKTEYSRFESSNNTVKVTIFPTPVTGIDGDVVNIYMIKSRRGRNEVVGAISHTFGSGDYTTGVEKEFVLEELIDYTYRYNLVHRGNYYVKAVYDPTGANVTGSSSDFRVAIITVERMRKQWLYGLDLMANDIRMVYAQPATITGVVVKDVSRTQPFGFSELRINYESTAPYYSLAWGGGMDVKIPSSGDYILRNKDRSGYIIVAVNRDALPTTPTTEELLIEKLRFRDEDIQKNIDDSVDYVENTALQIFVEPTAITTDISISNITAEGIDLTYPPYSFSDSYDKIVKPLTYFSPRSHHWLDFNFPWYQTICFSRLQGIVSNTTIVEVDTDWIMIDPSSGFVQLVPFNQARALTYLGLVWVDSLRGAMEIPNFWHFDAVSGFRDCPGDVMEVLGKNAAITILTNAGQAYRGGISAQSISRDGVSESISLTASAIYGVFSATITDYRRDIEEKLKRIRGSYTGIKMVVV